MSGTVNISRDLWDDPVFKDSEMSQREAWIWMIAEASWKDRDRRIGSTEIRVLRGQLAVSTRFLAKSWMWSEPRVRRYLDMLENRRMIQRNTDAGITVITICKYNYYQGYRRTTDAEPTHQATQDRRTTDANEKKGEIRDIGGGGSACAREADEVDCFEEIVAAAGVDLSKDISGKWHRSEQRHFVQRWRDLGLTQGEILGAIRDVQRNRDGPPGSLKYFDGPMERAAGLKKAPPLNPIPMNARSQTGQNHAERIDDLYAEAHAMLARNPF